MNAAPPLYVPKIEDQQVADARSRAKTQAAPGARAAKRLPDGTPKSFFAERRSMLAPLPERAEKAAPAPPPAGIVALTRLGFGTKEADLADFQALGGSDASRFQAFIDQQLDPASIDDSALDARIASTGFTTLGKTVAQLWSQHVMADDWQIVMQPFYEVNLVTWLRAIHSKRQLLEVMVDFWHNHFNVYGDEVPYGSLWAHYNRDVVRAHALGNFRQMLESVATSPAMLFYLDNAYNSSEDANENYARETLELHTLGAENYYGSIPPNQVPTDGNGQPLGYVEADVIEAARCLTGWTINSQWVHWEFGDTGEFMYYPNWHDTGTKSVVGLAIPAGQGAMQDGHDLFDHLCNHPGTARFIARKLCRRLLSDEPPQAVVDAAAATFLANSAASDQLARVVRTILEHPSFLTTWGEKVKRPFEIAVSMFRGASLDLPFTLDDLHTGITGWFHWEYWQTGQPLFSWQPPDGYPDIKGKWNSSSPRVMTWRIANMLLGIWNDDTNFWYFDLISMTPPSVRSSQELVDFWTQRILGRALPSGEEQPLVDFMAQGANPNTDLPLGSNWEVGERLRGIVGLIMMSPTFLWK